MVAQLCPMRNMAFKFLIPSYQHVEVSKVPSPWPNLSHSLALSLAARILEALCGIYLLSLPFGTHTWSSIPGSCEQRILF